MVLAKLKTRSLLSNRRADCTKYKYDVFGNRIEQIEDADGAGGGASVTTRFAWEGAGVLQDSWGNRTTPVGTENWNIWADLNGSNGLVTRYVRGDEVDQLFSRVKADGTVAHYLTDRMQSTRQMLDASGTVSNTITYDGFGNVLSETDAAFGDRWKWTGREYNNYTGLQYSRARYFSGESGTWVSEDMARFASGDYNMYRYVHGMTTNYNDPSGLMIPPDDPPTRPGPPNWGRGPIIPSPIQLPPGFVVKPNPGPIYRIPGIGITIELEPPIWWPKPKPQPGDGSIIGPDPGPGSGLPDPEAERRRKWLKDQKDLKMFEMSEGLHQLGNGGGIPGIPR